MRANGSKINALVKDMSSSPQVTRTTVLMNMAKRMVKVFTNGTMVKYMMENGLWASNTATEYGRA